MEVSSLVQEKCVSELTFQSKDASASWKCKCIIFAVSITYKKYFRVGGNWHVMCRIKSVAVTAGNRQTG